MKLPITPESGFNILIQVMNGNGYAIDFFKRNFREFSFYLSLSDLEYYIDHADYNLKEPVRIDSIICCYSYGLVLRPDLVAGLTYSSR